MLEALVRISLRVPGLPIIGPLLSGGERLRLGHRAPCTNLNHLHGACNHLVPLLLRDLLRTSYLNSRFLRVTLYLVDRLVRDKDTSRVNFNRRSLFIHRCLKTGPTDTCHRMAGRDGEFGIGAGHLADARPDFTSHQLGFDVSLFLFRLVEYTLKVQLALGAKSQNRAIAKSSLKSGPFRSFDLIAFEKLKALL